eukprot:CAMPEP_0113823138 /NCGR_PEP_ID=MMETSP0328-20130328/2592_1 /TAXON_ID=39455 /ORGANISM="Alexandrium minutum" /LENGTH=162 /DNA_ID=CAMNT_0000791077 /DNA_START=145 /DNA_END=631 /DNA_ORIENTATION=- /assembly_acc=CAM_ASM_000350
MTPFKRGSSAAAEPDRSMRWDHLGRACVLPGAVHASPHARVPRGPGGGVLAANPHPRKQSSGSRSLPVLRFSVSAFESLFPARAGGRHKKDTVLRLDLGALREQEGASGGRRLYVGQSPARPGLDTSMRGSLPSGLPVRKMTVPGAPQQRRGRIRSHALPNW